MLHRVLTGRESPATSYKVTQVQPLDTVCCSRKSQGREEDPEQMKKVNPEQIGGL